jgi:hypothetical protein
MKNESIFSKASNAGLTQAYKWAVGALQKVVNLSLRGADHSPLLLLGTMTYLLHIHSLICLLDVHRNTFAFNLYSAKEEHYYL